MDHAGDADGVIVTEDSFFVDGEVEKDDEGEPVEKGGEAEETERELQEGFHDRFLVSMNSLPSVS